MKTIAITIDEPTISAVDSFVGRKGRPWRSRSALIRAAIQKFVVEHERLAREALEREIIRKHRRTLSRQAAALVREQAKL